MNVHGMSKTILQTLLYAGNTAALGVQRNTALSAFSTTDVREQSGDVVEISDAAKAAYAASSGEISESGTSVKARIQAQFDAARADGTFISFDTSKGRLIDLSSFTDDELAQIKLDRSGEYPHDLSVWAHAALGQRVKVALDPFESGNPSDLRAYQTGVQQLYKAMSSEVREALGWDDSMIAMSKKLVAFSEEHHGKLDRNSFLQQFIEHLREMRKSGDHQAIEVDQSLFGFDDDD